MTDQIATLCKKIVPTLEEQGVIKAALFGSTISGEAKKNSDLDVLVRFSKKKSLLDIVRLRYKLEDKLGKKVDLLTYDSVHPLLQKSIFDSQIVFYEKES